MIERERRFKFKQPPPQDDITGSVSIEQVYTNSDGDSIPSNRIRKTMIEKSIDYSHCTKYNLGEGETEEIEFGIDAVQYNKVLQVTGKLPVKKTRYFVNIVQDEKVRVAEIDYYDDGEVIIEVEFTSEEDCDSFIAPAWFGDEIISKIDFSFEKFSKLNSKEIWN